MYPGTRPNQKKPCSLVESAYKEMARPTARPALEVPPILQNPPLAAWTQQPVFFAINFCRSDNISLAVNRRCPAIQLCLLTLMLFSNRLSIGQCVIEGKVDLPKPEPVTAPPPRYAGQVGEIAPPDPPTAVVYLEGKFPGEFTNAPGPAKQILQQGMQFHPALLPIQVGTAVKFPNADDFYHNVFSYSKPKRFDLGRYRKDDRPAPVVIFDKPGVVKLYCEIHQHMRGTILILNTPYFTTTHTNGEYQLTNLPSGSYLLKAWVDEKHEYEKPVSLKPGETLRADFDAK